MQYDQPKLYLIAFSKRTMIDMYVIERMELCFPIRIDDENHYCGSNNVSSHALIANLVQ